MSRPNSAGSPDAASMDCPRTAFLVAHHMDAHARRAGKLGARASRPLSESEDYEDLLLLAELDQRGRQPGATVCSVEEALEYVRGLGEAEE